MGGQEIEREASNETIKMQMKGIKKTGGTGRIDGGGGEEEAVRLAKKVGCKTPESLVRPRLICCQTERVWQVAGSILFHRLRALCFTLYESGKKVSAEKTAVRRGSEAE